MKVLLAIAHYYKAQADANHSSNDPAARDRRASAVRETIRAWRGHWGPASVVNIAAMKYEWVKAPADPLHIAVLVNEDDHLLDQAFCDKYRATLVNAPTKRPKNLPFAAHQLFASRANEYDLFVYSEDDLRPPDASMLQKIVGFTAEFGLRRVVMPNRYEWNDTGPTQKCFIDGPLRPELMERYFKAVRDDEVICQQALGRQVTYQRAANPHAGFFAITSAQLAYWMKQQHFGDMDASFVGPLESAATLGLLKTFAIYKPAEADMGWIEIEHLDRRFTSADYG